MKKHIYKIKYLDNFSIKHTVFITGNTFIDAINTATSNYSLVDGDLLSIKYYNINE